MSVELDTLVVGAGISGLTYAHARLASGAEDVVVVDAAEAPGGLVRTVEVAAPRLRYEAGPESISDPTGVMAELCEELGVGRVDAAATKRFLAFRGTLLEVPLAPQKMLASPLLSVGQRLRLLTEPFRRKGHALDGSIADFARHRLGQGALEALIEPMVAGIHAGDPEDLSFEACFPRMVQGLREHGSLFGLMRAGRGPAGSGRAKGGRHPWKPAGGMRALPDAFAERLGDRLRLGVRAESVERSADRWHVSTSDGPLSARRLVLALPLGATRRLLERAAPEAARELLDMRAESLVVAVHAWRREDVAHPLDGFGYLVAAREGLGHLGTLFPSSLDPAAAEPGVVVLRTMLGGARDPGAIEASDEALFERVRREVGSLVGLSGTPLLEHVHRWPETLPRFDLGHPGRLERLAAALPEGLALLGNHQKGIGLSSLVAEARALAEADVRAPGRRPA